MIGKVGQTSSSFFENTQQRKTVKNTAQPTTKTDEFIRSSSKSDLWSYSMKEVKSPIKSNSVFGFGKEPDWNIMPTKGMRSLSHEQLFNEMKTLAERQAIAKISKIHDSEWQREWDDIMCTFVNLQSQYISDVSPDRKALYEQAEKAIKKMKEDDEISYPITFTLVDYLCDLDDLEALAANNYGTVSKTFTTGYGTDYDVHFGGELVMGTSRGEWTSFLTRAESNKLEEFNNIFDKFYEHSKKGLASVQRNSESQR